MTAVLTAVGILCAIGAVCALLLVVASKYMSVPVDEKFPAIRGCLPGSNCGACGYAGCDGYANALASGEEEKTNKCVPGGADAATSLASVMGREADVFEAKAAVVGCKGTCNATSKKADFQGAKTCAAAKLLYGGGGMCHYGCIGFGDCASACTQHGITIVDGIPHINSPLCTGCGMCAKTCPNGIIKVLPADIAVRVRCSSHDKGAAVRAKCSAGCIGCGLCVRKCPNEAISLVNNLAVIDYSKCTGCGLCKESCPSKCID